jgi:uncharacterized protein
MVKNDSLRTFQFLPLMPQKFTTQAQADTLKKQIFSLPFYQGLLFNPETETYLMAVTLDKNSLNDKSRLTVTDNIVERAEKFEEETGNELHYSGMPYIRSVMTKTTKSELFLFIFLSIIIAAFILYLFFSSIRVVFSSLIVVAISIIFTWDSSIYWG